MSEHAEVEQEHRELAVVLYDALSNEAAAQIVADYAAAVRLETAGKALVCGCELRASDGELLLCETHTKRVLIGLAGIGRTHCRT